MIFRPYAVGSTIRDNLNDIAKRSAFNQTNKFGGKENMNFRKKEKEILDEVLGSSRYDSRIRPSGHQNDTSK